MNDSQVDVAARQRPRQDLPEKQTRRNLISAEGRTPRRWTARAQIEATSSQPAYRLPRDWGPWKPAPAFAERWSPPVFIAPGSFVRPVRRRRW